MPGYDKSGPMGLGSGTGRGQGVCNGNAPLKEMEMRMGYRIGRRSRGAMFNSGRSKFMRPGFGRRGMWMDKNPVQDQENDEQDQKL